MSDEKQQDAVETSGSPKSARAPSLLATMKLGAEAKPPAPPLTLTDERELTRWHAFLSLCTARFREVYREPEAVFWGFVFPIVLSVGLGVAFRNTAPDVPRVAVVDAPGADGIAEVLSRTPLLKTTLLGDVEAARALRLGKVALLVDPSGAGDLTYRLDPTRPEGLLARSRVEDALQRAAGRRDVLDNRIEEVTEPGARYIDFLIPGIIGMNLMGGGMWGVGFALVDMRIRQWLKRFLATPMRRSDFFASLMAIRLVFMFLEVGFLLLLGRLAFGVPVRGPLAAIFLVGAMGALTFSSLGLLVASRARRIESVTGLVNVVTMPMFVCSGVFFSTERFPDALQPVIRLLPLTALTDALRTTILEGTTLLAQADRLWILAVWTVVSFAVGLKIFRWT